MANRYSMQITIGGMLPISRIEDFYEAVDHEGVGFGWEGRPFAEGPEHLRALIEAERGEGLTMRDPSHAGRFDALEAFCRANELTFVVLSSMGAEVDGAELRWWSPGLDDVRWAHALEDGTPVVTVSSVRSILGEGPPTEQLARLEAWLMTQVPPDVPPLLLYEQ